MSRYSSRHRYDRISFFSQSKSKGERMADAAKKQQALEKKGVKLSPVVLEGSAIATTCWGKAWCKNIESYHDYANRLPRGRSYVRSRSVIDLQIAPGVVRAQVMGSSLYRIDIGIKRTARERWASICAACSGKIGSLVELLQGRISSEVMGVMTQPGEGLFPEPSEITLKCSCPDSASLCKHIAAVLYGIGSRLDRQPELLFLLRGADPADLLAEVTALPAAVAEGETLSVDELAGVFDVEIENEPAPAPVIKKPRGRPKKSVTPAATPATKPRGRPRKTPAPAATPVAPAPAVKKPRALPEKTASGETTATVIAPVPKKRGRPKKSASAAPLASASVPKKRGRPRKNISPEKI